MHQAYVGTSGFNYRDWKGKFYPKDVPQKRWLSYYATKFRTVEMNATFYGSFKKETYRKWAEQTPSDFQFVIKGSRFITHVKRLKNAEDSLNRQLDSASGLGKKLTIFLWQFPASFHKTVENRERLEKFISLLPKDVRQAFELRHESWFSDEIFSLLRSHNGAVIINETPAFAVTDEPNGAFLYIRFHGPQGLYSSSYSDKQMSGWAEKLKEWSKARDIYVYFNNDLSGYAIQNANTLLRFLE